MWVEVTRRDGDSFTGTLDNDPYDIPGLNSGDPVPFEAHHIIGVIWEDPAKKARFMAADAQQDRFFERCFVDDAVIEGRARAQYVYREPPESRPDDKEPDSGWRIRADVDALSDEEYEDTPASYVAIGVALNQDDSFLHLLTSPVGSAFLRDENDHYHPVEYNGEPIS